MLLTEILNLSLWQVCRDWWCRRLSLRQPARGATSHDKLVVMTTLGSQCCNLPDFIFRQIFDGLFYWYGALIFDIIAHGDVLAFNICRHRADLQHFHPPGNLPRAPALFECPRLRRLADRKPAPGDFQDPPETLQWRHIDASQTSTWLLVQQLDQDNSKEHEGSASLTCCEGNPPVISEFPSQRAINGLSVSISWCYYEQCVSIKTVANELSAKR